MVRKSLTRRPDALRPCFGIDHWPSLPRSVERSPLARMTAFGGIVLQGRRIRRDAPFRTRLDNNGQTSILARAGYDVNDPTRTFEGIAEH